MKVLPVIIFATALAHAADAPITQEELAGWTGSSREAVIRALRTLRELGWIETRRRGVTLLEVERMRGRAV